MVILSNVWLQITNVTRWYKESCRMFLWFPIHSFFQCHTISHYCMMKRHREGDKNWNIPEKLLPKMRGMIGTVECFLDFRFFNSCLTSMHSFFSIFIFLVAWLWNIQVRLVFSVIVALMNKWVIRHCRTTKTLRRGCHLNIESDCF